MVSSFAGIREIEKLRHKEVNKSQQGTGPGLEPRGSNSRTSATSSGTKRQLHRVLRGQWLSSSAPVSSAEPKASHLCIQGLSSSPIHHQGPVILPVDARLSLDVSVPEQRCSSYYLGRLWPQKYLVSSHSVKWN
ncbi:chromosome 16 open reading frame 47 [Homo sapiens]|nr:chromosome 16 open reading frame 47 [Homo sapiens]BAC85221.1 unnamed protein product [Homo sapiens]|eukprot:NP_997268.1 putative uncharacterized protein C16orf47 [Homo sapiens]